MTSAGSIPAGRPRVLLLIATSSYRADDFLDAAGRLDVDVTVGSDHRQVLARFTPGASLYVDFTDVPGSVQRIRSLNARHPLAAVVAAEDEGTELAAEAAAALGLSHNPPAAVRAARHKDRLRAALARAGLPAPRYRVFQRDDDPATAEAEAARQVGYPCVLKPTFLSASRGVIRVDDAAGFVAAWHRIGAILDAPDVRGRDPEAARRILAESYMEGDEVALEGLLHDGRLETLAILDKPEPLAGPYFEETIYIRPSRLPRALQRALSRATEQASAALGLRDGPVHAELRHDAGEARIVELAPRSIGGLCSRILRFGLDTTLETLILRHALGRSGSGAAATGPASGVMMLPVPGAGVLREVRGVESARAVPGVEGVVILARPGETLVPLPEGHRYPGFIFARDSTPARVEHALREAHRRIALVLE